MTNVVTNEGQPRFHSSEVEDALGIKPLRFLGAGAFADTWTDNESAFKLICSEDYPESRLARERDGLMRVSNRHVVKLKRVFDVTVRQKVIPVLQFEFINGGDLSQKLGRSTTPNYTEVHALLRGLLNGIAALHSADETLHRDIKPQNIALREGKWSEPVILDLGMAKSLNEQTVTIYPGLVGTPLYMAPEQLRAERALKASDLFSIGTTVREAILGHHPFYYPDLPQTAEEALNRLEQGPSPLPPDAPADLVRVLDRLVHFNAYMRRTADMNLRDLVQHV